MLPALPSANSHLVHLDNNSNSQRSANKRASSMIFRIEHLLPSSAPNPELSLRAPPPLIRTPPSTSEDDGSAYATSSANQSAAKRSKQPLRSGLHVAQFTPKDTVSEPLSTLHLMCGKTMMGPSNTNSSHCTLTHGALALTPPMLRRIKLSEDIHSYNALFELQRGSVRIRVVRDIARDDELVAWFGEEVSLLMSIPFLTPLHIQGNNRYTCHLCHLSFETPNPLKIHLALGCGRHSMDILWVRLHYAIKASSYTQQLLPGVSLSPIHPPSSNSSSISPNASPQRFSAFKPISPATSVATSHIGVASSIATSMSLPHMHYTNASSSSSVVSNPSLAFLPTLTSTGMPSMNLLQPHSSNPLNAAAQIEAIVSNMGASKQGHLCIYCGKVYSRKYGLKIHIRTHTGFKPLKCKYCLRPFGDPSNLNKHVRLHLQSNTSNSGSYEGYKCHLCHKTLARRRDLQRHIESRHSAGEQPQAPRPDSAAGRSAKP